VNIVLEKALTNRGADVISTLTAGNNGTKDEEQLIYAMNQKRCIITHNIGWRFCNPPQRIFRNNRTHLGIIVTDQLPVGVLVKRIMNLWFSLEANEMENRIDFLSNWKQE